MQNEAGYIAAPLNCVPQETILPFPIFIRVAGKMTCLRNAGDTFSADRLRTLRNRIDVIFVPEASWMAFVGHLEKVTELEKGDAVRNPKNIHSLLLAYSKHMERMREVQRSTVHKIRDLAYDLVSATEKSRDVTATLLKRFKDGSIYYANHNVNISLYAIAIGKKLGYRQAELKELSFSCLVANIGNALLPEEVLYRNGKLSETEWLLVKGHSGQGAELLEYLDAPTEVVTVARQHHERMDGKGYPFGLFGQDIHPYSRICAIADVYDALTCQKPYGKDPVSPKAAIAEMQSMGGKFDPEIIGTISN